MAINKTAKNLVIEIDNKYTSISKTFIETAEKVEVAATAENLVIASNKKVAIKGNK